MQAGIYLRISQDRTGEELGVTRQREDCEKLAVSRGWDVHRIYVDNDVSAKGDVARPGWEAMMCDVEGGHIQAVVGWTIDRTLRSGRDRLRMLELGKAHGLVITLVRGSDMDLSTPAGRLAADILGAVALNEIEAKADRQRRAHVQAAQQGRWVGGRRPFGFERDGMTVRSDEAAALRAAYHDYLAGTPLGVIARRWNDAGLLSGVINPKTGEPTRWGVSGIRWVLKNARYAGQRVHNGEVVGKAQWPALVDEATFRAVNALLGAVAAEQKPRGGRRLLTGVARCGVCDAPIHAGGNKAGNPQAYRCRSGRHVIRRAAPVEEYVSAVAVAGLSRPDVAELLSEPGTGGEDLDLAAEEIRGQMDTIALERVQRTITQRQFTNMNAELMTQLQQIEARMVRTGRSSGVRELLRGGMDTAKWEAIGVDQQRTVIAALMTVHLFPVGKGVANPPPETIRVEWRTGG